MIFCRSLNPLLRIFTSFILMTYALQVDAQDTPPTATPAAAVTPAAADLTVHVYAKGSGVPIGRAEISIGDEKLFTAPDGKVQVPRPIGSKIMKVSRFGFQSEELSGQSIGSKKDLEVYLLPAIGADDTIIVSGKRRPGVSRQVISVEEASKIAPGGDPGQVTKLLPGVQQAAFQPEVSIRGSAPTDSKYFVDDLEVPFVYHVIGQNTVIPVSLISDVEYSAGGFGAEYGDATGGVISIRTKTEIPERPITRFQLNLPLFSGVYHERPVSENVGVSASFRRSYLELILPAVIPKDSGVTVVPYFTDSHIVVTRKRDDGHDKLTIMSAGDGIKAVAPGGLSNDEDGRGQFDLYTYFGILGWERMKRLNTDWSYVTTPQFYYFKTKVAVTDNRFLLHVYRYKMPTEATYRLNKDEKVYFGIDPAVGVAKVEFLLPLFDPSDPFFDFEEAPKIEGKENAPISSIAGWVGMDKKVSDLTLTPGVRGFYNSQIKRTGADPRLSARYPLTDNNTLKGAVGQFSKSPDPGEAAESAGNPHLLFERSIHYILGLETKWDDRWTTDLQVFHKKGFNFVRSDSETRYNNDGSFRSTGAELFIRRNLTSRLFGWLSYAYSITDERASDEEPWHNGEHDQTQVVNLVGNYKLTALWDAGGRFNYHTGDTYTPKGTGAVYNTNFDKYQPRADSDIEPSSGRLPPYHELALYFSRDSLFDTWKLIYRFGVEYLWFERQAFGVQDNYDYSKEELFKGVPPIPYLEVRGEF